MEVTVKLLENAMGAAMKEARSGDGWTNGKGRFLIDGFPRKMDQAVKFDEEVCNLLNSTCVNFSHVCQVCLSSIVLFFTTTEQVMLARLLERGKTSGREDDNEESIKKRFRKSSFCQLLRKWLIVKCADTYKDQTMPVIEHYQTLGKVVEASHSPVRACLTQRLIFAHQVDSTESVEVVHKKASEVVNKLFAQQLS